MSQANTKDEVAALVQEVAKARSMMDSYEKDADILRTSIAQTIESQMLDELTRNTMPMVAARVYELEALLKQGALRYFAETEDKHPTPGVDIKVFTELEYDKSLALDYCREHLPSALKLDSVKFERVAKVLAEEPLLSFVKQHETPRAEIRRDLGILAP